MQESGHVILSLGNLAFESHIGESDRNMIKTMYSAFWHSCTYQDFCFYAEE